MSLKVSRGAIIHIQIDLSSDNFIEEFCEALDILDEWHTGNWPSPVQFFSDEKGVIYGDDLELLEK